MKNNSEILAALTNPANQSAADIFKPLPVSKVEEKVELPDEIRKALQNQVEANKDEIELWKEKTKQLLSERKLLIDELAKYQKIEVQTDSLNDQIKGNTPGTAIIKGDVAVDHSNSWMFKNYGEGKSSGVRYGVPTVKDSAGNTVPADLSHKFSRDLLTSDEQRLLDSLWNEAKPDNSKRVTINILTADEIIDSDKFKEKAMKIIADIEKKDDTSAVLTNNPRSTFSQKYGPHKIKCKFPETTDDIVKMPPGTIITTRDACSFKSQENITDEETRKMFADRGYEWTSNLEATAKAED